jgi:hypothetical protein
VEYGFALQRWVLKNFKVVAIMESLDEPWFPDARVKTAIAILQRSSDQDARDKNLVRFVRFLRPVSSILGERRGTDETARQTASDKLRKLILQTAGPAVGEPIAVHSSDRLRIITVRQFDLWQEGVRAWELLKQENLAETTSAEEDSDSSDQSETSDTPAELEIASATPDYAAGKWGRFVRAPDIYFRLVRDYKDRFVRLGEVAEVKFGIKSGCDAFFMPRDVTAKILKDLEGGLPWNEIGLMTNCKRKELESGEVRVIRAGDNSLHPIEAKFIRPEVHSLMEVDRPVVRAADCQRVVLWVNQELQDIADTYAAKYIRWGAKTTFTSKKSKPVKVPERSTCAARIRWYDLTGIETGVAFWPMAQQYRHIIPMNPENLVCNHNMFYIKPRSLSEVEAIALQASLNSTITGLVKHFYGRYAGTEANLKTEVCDTVLLEIPSPRAVSPQLARRIQSALDSMARRKVTHLVQESMLKCHTEDLMREILARPVELSEELQQSDRRDLDDAVFEMLGISDKHERTRLLDELYAQTAGYYRHQRALEIQGMRNRMNASRKQMSPRDLAASVWDSLTPEERGEPVADWIKNRWPVTGTVTIPDGKPSARGADDMFSPASVSFKQGSKTVEKSYASPEQAALVVELANLEYRGEISVPDTAQACHDCCKQLESRLTRARTRFTELACSRTGQLPMQEKVIFTLLHWYTHGQD